MGASSSWLATSTEQPWSAPADPPLADSPLADAAVLVAPPALDVLPPELLFPSAVLLVPAVVSVTSGEAESELEQAVSPATSETAKAKAEARRASRSEVCTARSIPHSVTRCDRSGASAIFRRRGDLCA